MIKYIEEASPPEIIEFGADRLYDLSRKAKTAADTITGLLSNSIDGSTVMAIHLSLLEGAMSAVEEAQKYAAVEMLNMSAEDRPSVNSVARGLGVSVTKINSWLKESEPFDLVEED